MIKTLIKILILAFSLPIVLVSLIIFLWDVCCAIGYRQPIDVLYGIPFLVVSLLWSTHLAGAFDAGKEKEKTQETQNSNCNPAA